VRVLVLTQHFPPEITAASFRLEAFARALADRGHEVHVLCPVPNHPSGLVADGYRHRPIVRRVEAGIRVSHLWVVTSSRKTLWTRLAYYGSYAAAGALAGALGKRPDVILASSPPLTVAVPAGMLAHRHRAPLVLDVRDLWPASAVALGELRPGRLLAAAERLERWAYRSAERLITANEAFARSIAATAPPGRGVEVIPNGTTAAWLEAGKATVPRASLGLPEDRFILAYAGNFGLAHGLEIAVDAVGLLDPDVLLLLIGEGPRRASVAERARPLGGRVALRGLMEPADAARHLRAADALLVSERQDSTVSAKLYDMCAIGRPIIAACTGELRRVVEREKVALPVPHGDARALAEAVRALRSDPALGQALIAAARRFAEAHRRERQGERAAALLESVAATR